MAIIDLTEAQLADYDPVREEPADFDAFWRETLAEARKHDLDPVFTPVSTALATVQVHDVTFSGWAGDRIKGWLLLPAAASGPLPCVVEYIGYNCGRATPYQWLLAPAAGFATLVVDNRGQGSYLPGDTPDPNPEPRGGSGNGYLTRDLGDPRRHYYRRLMTDAVRAVEVARAHPAVDGSRIAVTGGSQGGGLALTVAGLVPDLAAVVAHAPFLCYYRRASQATDAHPYFEITRYLRTNTDRIEQTFQTLSYFDAVNHAARITAPTLISVPLMDDVCPPSTTMAAYRHCAGPKRLKVWPYGDHSGGETHSAGLTAEFLAEHLG
ncbi:acetylxylan esterase [Dactylosporangium siamense]|uniref:Cephalosporin-C deacetylase n=1 Tax=Dactylosporangium siamense TaxID=685454 RepID=A0A919PTB0_9ACTN|nr:acetylxylan esterase [Dactylosporangium siamense]GIG48003.1 cephalosporin-C deacetylase [Dactylosporangium siamense]